MILHTDRVDTCPLEHCSLRIGVISVGCATVTPPRIAGSFIDNEAVVREIFFGKLKAPSYVIGIIVKSSPSFGPPHLVSHFDRGDLICVSLGDLGVSALELALDFFCACTV